MFLKFLNNKWLFTFAESIVSALLFFAVVGTKIPVDQASALVALPLIIFSTVEPYVFAQTMAWITRRLTKEPAPAPPSVAPEWKSLSFRRRAILVASGLGLMVFFFSSMGSVAVLVSSFIYPYLGMPWASRPARFVALALFGVSVFLVIGFVTAVAVITTRESQPVANRERNLLRFAIRFLPHWPLAA